MHVYWSTGNRRMEGIARRFGAEVTGDGGQFEAMIPVPPSDASIFEEALADGSRRARRAGYTNVMPT